MTYLEKAKELNPELSDTQIISYLCPEHVLNIDCIFKCPTDKKCSTCWNREMPEVKNE